MHHPIYPRFQSCKATETYLKLIHRARSRDIDGYRERHHIVPQALGGDDSPSNLVDLTAREHFICHLLLVKMTVGQDRAKMAFAANMLVQAENSEQQRYRVTGRLYELVKREFSKARGELNTKLWADEAFRAKMLSKWTEERREWYQEMGRARLADHKVRAEYAARADKLWADDEYRAKVTAANKAYASSDIGRAQRAATSKALWKSEEHRAKMGNAISAGRQQKKADSLYCSFGDVMDMLKLSKPKVRELIEQGHIKVASRNSHGHCKIEKASVLSYRGF